MRRRTIAGAISILLVAGIAYGRADYLRSRHAVARIAVSSHGVAGNLLMLGVIVTNAGSSTLVAFGEPPFSTVRFQTPTGATNVFPKHFDKTALTILLPGHWTSNQVSVPCLGTRFNVGGRYHKAGVRDTLVAYLLTSRWRRHLGPVLDLVARWQPERPAEESEAWSQEIELGN